MKSLIKPIFDLSKALWIVSISVYLSITLSGNAINDSGLELFNVAFMVVSMVLIIIDILACFAPLPEKFDLSLLNKSEKQSKENILSRPKVIRLLKIYENISNILIYVGVLLYVFYSDKGLLPFLSFGLFSKAILYAITAFEPQNEDQRTSETFPELKQ